MILGVTGLIGSGKSLAAATLQKWGAIVIDADEIGREVVESSVSLRKSLARVFGADILTVSGNIRRKVLARRAFVDENSQAKLNRLVHPRLLKELRRRVKSAAKRGRLVVIDAALLLDWNLDREIDRTLLVHASLETRLRRLIRRGLTRTDAIARTGAQLPYGEYRRRADFVIYNDSTRMNFERKLREKLAAFI